MSAAIAERYFTDIAETRGTNSHVAETSFYPALEHLLTEVGTSLAPRVRGARGFPLYVREPDSLLSEARERANLSETAAAYLATVDCGADEFLYHVLATLHAASYRQANASALRQDWPRIPLPKAKEALLASAALGRQVATLLDTEAPVPGVTAGKIREELKRVAVFQRVDGKPANPDTGDLDVTAGWGHAGKGGVTMPGRGRLQASSDAPDAFDVYLNNAACWRQIPVTVWDYTIGGYQVIKKWLSYREKPLLGRGLTPEEVRHVTDTARRLAALIALQPALDANYRVVASQRAQALQGRTRPHGGHAE